MKSFYILTFKKFPFFQYLSGVDSQIIEVIEELLQKVLQIKVHWNYLNIAYFQCRKLIAPNVPESKMWL